MSVDFLDDQIATLNTTIVERLSALTPPETMAVPVAADKSAIRRAPHIEAATPVTFDQAITLLDTMPGVDRRGAEMLVAEIGPEMSRFGTAARLAAWAGVAPGNDASAGQRRSGKTRKGNRRCGPGSCNWPTVPRIPRRPLWRRSSAGWPPAGGSNAR